MAEFRIPGKILYGNNTAEYLSSIKGERLLMVYDDPAGKAAALKHLKPSGIKIRLFEAAPTHADTPHIAEGTKALMEFKPDWILAVGSHSAMDTAKLIRIFYQRPDLTLDDAIQGYAADISLDKTRLITLPLYNTNGGEVTGSAFFTDTKSEMECAVFNPALMPDISIIDPAVSSFPDSGKEALCILSTFVLAIEASICKDCCFSRPMALEAIALLTGSIPAHASAPHSTASLLYAQCLAGMASANSPHGLCNAMCRGCAPALGSPSLGGLGAILLPEIIRQDEHQERYIAAAQAMGLSDATALADAVQEYADMLGLPLTLNEMGISKNLLLKKLSRLSHKAASLLPSQSEDDIETQKHIEQILRSAYSADK